MAERILAVVSHPDDETFSIGGTLARHALSGDHVAVVVMADGLASRGGVNPANIALRQGACRRACKTLGLETDGAMDIYFHQFTDNEMDKYTLLESVKFIERHIQRMQPTIVYTHWRGDLNVDHRVVHDAVNVACRPMPGMPVKRILYFEVPCSTAWGSGFAPNYYVDVSSTWERKIDACKHYASELREAPHPRSITGITTLALLRGYHVGVNAAEAYIVGRWVE